MPLRFFLGVCRYPDRNENLVLISYLLKRLWGQRRARVGDDARIETVKLGAAGIVQPCIGAEWSQQSRS